MNSWQCIVCGFIYDEAKGLPEDGIAPVPLGRMYQITGSVQIVEYQNLTLKWCRFNHRIYFDIYIASPQLTHY